MVIHCQECGAENEVGNLFCRECGVKLEISADDPDLQPRIRIWHPKMPRVRTLVFFGILFLLYLYVFWPVSQPSIQDYGISDIDSAQGKLWEIMGTPDGTVHEIEITETDFAILLTALRPDMPASRPGRGREHAAPGEKEEEGFVKKRGMLSRTGRTISSTRAIQMDMISDEPKPAAPPPVRQTPEEKPAAKVRDIESLRFAKPPEGYGVGVRFRPGVISVTMRRYLWGFLPLRYTINLRDQPPFEVISSRIGNFPCVIDSLDDLVYSRFSEMADSKALSQLLEKVEKIGLRTGKMDITTKK